jgi:ribonuclease D
MTSVQLKSSSLWVYHGDLPQHAYLQAKRIRLVAWDLETSGLEWARDRIATCQLYIPGVGVYVVRMQQQLPACLVELLESQDVTKVFHHAMFDLRFMAAHWKASPRAVVCTKIAAKILDPDRGEYGLQLLLERYLGRHIDKALRLSNWLAPELTVEQIQYAASDVLHLIDLFKVLEQRLTEQSRLGLAASCFHFLPTRVSLDLIGSGDIFVY